jgi:hypothetical protein
VMERRCASARPRGPGAFFLPTMVSVASLFWTRIDTLTGPWIVLGSTGWCPPVSWFITPIYS